MKLFYFIPAIIWLTISVILLTLPQKDLPHSAFFDLPYFDKFVHLGMFFLLTALFSFPFLKFYTPNSSITATLNTITFSVIIYGILMEFVQKFLAQGRSFDLFDIFFDCLGSFAGLIAIRLYLKQIGPNENRGRNQN